MRIIDVVLMLTISSVAMAVPEIVIQANQDHRPVSPRLWGIFYEDINHSADGGLYAELIRNRAFEDHTIPPRCTIRDGKIVAPGGWSMNYAEAEDPPAGWSLIQAGDTQAALELDDSFPLNPHSPHAGKLTVKRNNSGRAGLLNAGFWGIPLKAGESYTLKLYARAGHDNPGAVAVSLQSIEGDIYDQVTIEELGPAWKQYIVTLIPNHTDADSRLAITVKNPGIYWFDYVSLFPVKTWKNQPNGLRADIAQMLADLEPAFVRFPGGCIVEGFTLDNAWSWKRTIGPPEERPGFRNLWGYHASDGLGFFELLRFLDEIGAEPMYIQNCGMSCQARGPIEAAPLHQLDPWIREALDAIEFANAPADRGWGQVRARLGHPEPFNLRLLGIGNENWGAEYSERYLPFYQRLKIEYPEIETIATAEPAGHPVDMVDHHYYATPHFFLTNVNRYDEADRNGPAIIVTEFAANQNAGNGNLEAAVCEAAFMIGLERNADLIEMAAYAPLLQRHEDRTWPVNLICFNGTDVYGIPSYYVQKLFSTNQPDWTVPVRYDESPIVLDPRQGTIGLGTWSTESEYKDIQVTHNGQILYEWNPADGLKGWIAQRGTWSSEGGTIRQQSLDTDCTMLLGDESWENFTLTLKARKRSGKEGFLILFRAKDRENWYWWNIGGWGNTMHRMERSVTGSKDAPGEGVSGSIETGRWYDIRITVEGDRIQCQLDGKLIHDERYKPISYQTVAVGAGYDEKHREWIMKVVNANAESVSQSIAFEGEFQGRKITVNRTVLTSASRLDENSFENPRKVSPKTESIGTVQPPFVMEFPAYSLTILRITPAL